MVSKHFLVGSLIVLAIVSPSAAVIIYKVEAPHDDAGIRAWAQKRALLVIETDRLTHLIESRAVVDESKLADLGTLGRRRTLSRVEIEKKLGAPSKFKEDEYVRPWAGNAIIPFSGLVDDDLKPENDRVQFYEAKGIGGLRIIYDKDGFALSPSVLFLRTDRSFVTLRDEASFFRRVDWELAKLKALKVQFSIKDDLETNKAESLDGLQRQSGA